MMGWVGIAAFGYLYATYGNRSYLVWMIVLVWLDLCWDIRHRSGSDEP